MPTKCGLVDSHGTFCRWGEQGKAYYYKPSNKESLERAKKKADAQGAAAYASGYRGAFLCECLKCGYLLESENHCVDVKCPKCGDEMRGTERPNQGQAEIKKALDENWKRIVNLSSGIELALPSVKPGESEQKYVSRCIRFEKHRSPDRPDAQIQRMCYEKFREATGGKAPPGIKAESSDEISLDNNWNIIESIAKDSRIELALKPGYYSRSKPFYRFEMKTLDEELKSAKWTGRKLLVDCKVDGLRLSLGKLSGEPFIYVDPSLLKLKSASVIKRLPTIANELKRIPDNTILDGELIMVHGNEILHRTTSNAMLNATKFSPEKLSRYARVFVFDILYFDGEDIKKHPLHERLEYLQRIKSSEHIWIEKTSSSIENDADGYLIDGSDSKKLHKIISKIMESKFGRPLYMAEGTMIKDMASPYEIPTNHGWGKLKKFYEVDLIVWGREQVKNAPGVYNYKLGYTVSKEHYEHIPNKYRVPDKLMAFFGKSDNCKLEVGIDKVLRVASEEVLKQTNEGYPYYRGYINVALEPVPEKSQSDSLEVLDKLSQFQPKRIPMEELERLKKDDILERQSSEHPTTQEEVADIPKPSGQKAEYPSPSGSRDEEPREEEPEEEVLESIKKTLDAEVKNEFYIPETLGVGSQIVYKGRTGTIVKIIEEVNA